MCNTSTLMDYIPKKCVTDTPQKVGEAHRSLMALRPVKSHLNLFCCSRSANKQKV